MPDQPERLDHYLARTRPDLGDQSFWYAECDANRVEVRDSFSLATGMFSGKGWFFRWYDGKEWQKWNLPNDERPRIIDGFCHIVKEG